jgi:two-component sensor histidine kinase
MRRLSPFLLLVSGLIWGPLRSSPLPDPSGPDRPALSMERLRAELYLAGQEADQGREVKVLREIRDLQIRYGALDSAVMNGIRIVGMSGLSGDRKAMAGDWSSMALAYQRLGSLSEAVDAQKRALLILRTTGNPKLVDPALLDLLDLLLEAKRFPELKHASDEALRHMTGGGSRSGRTRILSIQGQSLLEQGRPADALSLLHLTLRDTMGMGNGELKAKTYFALARANADIHDWQAARTQFDQGSALAPGAEKSDPKLYGLRARIEEGTGDLRSALRSERLQLAATDSIRTATRAERLTQLQALYALKLKDHDMDALRAENQAATGALANERRRAGMAIIGGMVLLALVVLLSLLRGRHLGTLRRTRLKNAVIHRQADEILVKNIELEQHNLRLREILENEQEKDLVLMDVQYRTKDSLQLVSALLKMQAFHGKTPHMESLMRDLQGRIHSMALVHEHLYKCGDLNRVNVKAHFIALAKAVLRHHGLEQRMTVEFDISHDRARPADLTPLSLLLNELLTSSAKHAASQNRSGRILVVLRPLAEHRCELLFTDEGTGLEQERFLQADSFSSELIQVLARQLNGTIHLLRSDVLTFQMTFDAGERDRMLMAS